MRPFYVSLVFAFAAVPSEAPLSIGQRFPDIQGQTLSGRAVQLPLAVQGKPAVVIMGFSKEAGKPSLEWARRFVRDHNLSAVPIYQIPVLERAPRLIRPLIQSALRKEVEPPLHDFALLVYRGEQVWKQRVGFSEPGHSYIFVLDKDARVIARASGLPNEAEYQRLKSSLRSTLESVESAHRQVRARTKITWWAVFPSS